MNVVLGIMIAPLMAAVLFFVARGISAAVYRILPDGKLKTFLFTKTD